jgi:chorismate mutase / prephenate dehydratase
MAKKTTAHKSKSRPTLASLRAEIDRVDRDLIKLMNQRAEVALKIGQLKSAEGQSIYAPSREEEVIGHALTANKGPLTEFCVRAIYRELISGSRALEKILKVAYLGPAYSYSHLAAIERFGQSVEFVPVGSISAVFEEVNRGHTDFGLVPLENSTDGRIADTLDMFTRLPQRICGEVQLRIHHNLLGRCPRGDVSQVYSRPQALSQCRNWLAKHLPNARPIEVTSTSTAAQLAVEKPGAAAIASREAGVHYSLELLAENIEDNQANLTRFAVIGDLPPERTGRDKTAIMFQVDHKPGALADAMTIFKKNKLNLTWIESFPVSGPKEGYLFFVEFAGHERDARVMRAVTGLHRKALRLEVLGTYPMSPPVNET